jgi:hypothetical protein
MPVFYSFLRWLGSFFDYEWARGGWVMVISSENSFKEETRCYAGPIYKMNII